MLGTYAKAAAALVPGASRLPFVAGGGGAIPVASRTLDGVSVDRSHLADYDRVCGFRLRDELPATYPHVLAFGLHMQLMTDGKFPFPAVGLVHVANRIDVRRSVLASETLDVSVHATQPKPHPKGKTFSIVTSVSASDELVWTEESTMLRRGASNNDVSKEEGSSVGGDPADASASWKLPADLGRRYAGVSGDSNPIHLHSLTARLFGFPSAIAHGMWTKARCLAALEHDLPDAYAVDVEFKRPILLPATVGFGRDGDRFAVRSGDTIHLEGAISAR